MLHLSNDNNKIYRTRIMFIRIAIEVKWRRCMSTKESSKFVCITVKRKLLNNHYAIAGPVSDKILPQSFEFSRSFASLLRLNKTLRSPEVSPLDLLASLVHRIALNHAPAITSDFVYIRTVKPALTSSSLDPTCKLFIGGLDEGPIREIVNRLLNLSQTYVKHA